MLELNLNLISGLGDVGPLTSSCSSNSCSSSSSSMKRPVESSFPRLESRTGTGLKVTSPKVETPSKRTKKTDKAKLLRTVSYKPLTHTASFQKPPIGFNN